ncbi:MAG: hypothetical protein CSB01_01700 [Bacteroidia bacterium]|nr:MAG: hypothetical protein CSB01_01700 [Bacteroidia bacterium]
MKLNAMFFKNVKTIFSVFFIFLIAANSGFAQKDTQNLTQNDLQPSDFLFIELADYGIAEIVKTANFIKEFSVGGIIFQKNKENKEKELLNYFSTISKTPLIFACSGKEIINEKACRENIYTSFCGLEAIADQETIKLFARHVAEKLQQKQLNAIYRQETKSKTDFPNFSLFVAECNKYNILNLYDLENYTHQEKNANRIYIRKIQTKDIRLSADFYRKQIEILTNSAKLKILRRGNVLLKKIRNNIVSKSGKTNTNYIRNCILQESVCVLKNKANILPLLRPDTLKIAALNIGEQGKSVIFTEYLNKYFPVKNFNISCFSTKKEISGVLKNVKGFNLIIVGAFGMKRICADKALPKNYANVLNHLNNEIRISGKNKELIFCSFASKPLLFDECIKYCSAYIYAPTNNALMQKIVPQVIFGGISAKGKLPASLSQICSDKKTITTKGNLRFRYACAEDENIDSEKLNKRIDNLIANAISKQAFPGCQVFIVKNGNVIFDKAYGFHTYAKRNAVEKTDLYDLASLTKILAPLPALMRLFEQKKYKLDDKFSATWNDWEKRLFRPSDKAALTWREIMAHQAGLKSWIPFWKESIENKDFNPKLYAVSASEDFPYWVNENLYLHKKFRKKIYKAIRKSELRDKKKYHYSGLSFFIYPEIIEKCTKTKYEKYLYNKFYKPLGITRLTYNPAENYPTNCVPPTENDIFFRKRLIHNFVHDEGAAIMGGISGNAGLFGNAEDVAKLMQMYMNFGKYGGKTYFQKNTIQEFTKCQFSENKNHRGLIFDKPYLDNHKRKLSRLLAAPQASPESFGHSGFTGTFAWADPKNNLLLVFLCNRIYPTRENKNIYRLNLRTKLHKAIYDLCENK